jgi:hypothetical protein
VAQDFPSIDVDPKMLGRQANQVVAGAMSQGRRDRAHSRQKERRTRFLVERLYVSWQSYREVFRSISAKEPP